MVNDDEVKDNSRSNQAIKWGFQAQMEHKANSDPSEPVQDNNKIPGTTVLLELILFACIFSEIALKFCYFLILIYYMEQPHPII